MLRVLYHIGLLIGVNPREWRHLRLAPRFLRELFAFRRAGGKVTTLYPILADYRDSAGSASGHYFHQDLIIAQAICAASPARHLDVGSRIDGFVAHVATFREIDVLDLRTLETGHPNIRFVQADLMQKQPELAGSYPSVSCLHALEHFGLGRYGDAIAPDGHRRGFDAVAELVAPGGIFYMSVPIGTPQVAFNAHRIFDAAEPLSWAASRFTLERFDYVDDAGALHRDVSPADAVNLNYGCGIYSLRAAL
jgi:Caenorhabditis protein of unknown function, DUF268